MRSVLGYKSFYINDVVIGFGKKKWLLKIKQKRLDSEDKEFIYGFEYQDCLHLLNLFATSVNNIGKWVVLDFHTGKVKEGKGNEGDLFIIGFH